MINPYHMRDLIIAPTLRHLGLYSKSAERLLLLTWFHESTVGNFTMLRQVGGGPAIGPYQIEPDTHTDNFKTFLNFPGNENLRMRVVELASLFSKSYDEQGKVIIAHSELVTNFAYATAQARIKYWRVPAPLPAPYDVQGIAEYWHKYYCSCGNKSLRDFKTSSWRLRDLMNQKEVVQA